VRGTLSGGVSYTGCQQTTASSVGFFYDAATSTTYHECFSDGEPSLSTPVIPNELVTPVNSGIVLLPAASAESLARIYAVAFQGQQESAYRINLSSAALPSNVYCIGRGTVDDSAAACVMNGCGDTPGDFIVFGPGAAAGEPCFHNCYTE